MTRDEIVTALRCCASSEADCKGNCAFFGTSSPNEDCSQRKNTAAADLIENQQRHIEALMQANAALRDTVLRRDAQIENMSEGLAQFAKAVAAEEEQSELHAMKNELCQYCGKYKQAHEGACDGCRWKEEKA
jgi:predicted RNase H-like nuclease (RuvC/YqgF family)|nr:MAG TPA: zinc finger protein [Caudoviricetes sp.]